jgi:uncharacterized protein
MTLYTKLSFGLAAAFMFCAAGVHAGPPCCQRQCCANVVPASQPATQPASATAWDSDHAVFQFLLQNRDKIRRQVSNIDKGVVTVTESDDPVITKAIITHVHQMHARITEGRGIHMRDPLFRAIFASAKSVKMQVDDTAKGVKVTETSDDALTTKLIQAHAEVVSNFIKFGHTEVRKNHDVPKE